MMLYWIKSKMEKGGSHETIAAREVMMFTIALGGSGTPARVGGRGEKVGEKGRGEGGGGRKREGGRRKGGGGKGEEGGEEEAGREREESTH